VAKVKEEGSEEEKQNAFVERGPFEHDTGDTISIFKIFH